MEVVKPPLGIMPRHLWEEKRMIHIAEAIKRYAEVGKAIPQEWVDEYNELAKKREP